MDEDVKNLILAISGIVLVLGGYSVISNWQNITTGIDSQAVMDFFNIKTYE
jgi:hypothetical protein